MTQTVLIDREDGIATVTLNRPEKLNAYTVHMGEEIVDAFDTLQGDESVKAIILTGAGRGFCAGVDLDHLKEQHGKAQSDGPKLGEERLVREFPITLQEFPKPVIAAINGAAIGVGVTMILPCDIRLASDTAKFGLTFTKIGILPGLGSTYLLPRLVGEAKARELILTANIISAEEAAAIGLVNQTVAADELMPLARKMALAMAECKPEVLKAAKGLLNENTSSLREAMEKEQKASAKLREE